MTKQSMGDLIASLRKERGMTQKELALQMNVTDKAVSKWERNLSCPDINSVPRLAQVLGVSVEELMTTTAQAKQEDDESEKRENLIDLILRVVPFALGISVIVQGILNQTDPGTSLTGVALLCISIYQIRQSRR